MTDSVVIDFETQAVRVNDEWFPEEASMELGKPYGDINGNNGLPLPVAPKERVPLNDFARFKEPPPYKPTETDRFMLRLAELFGDALETARKKNADYANTGDPFANFRGSVKYGVPTEKGLMVRIEDKMQRIGNLLDRPAQVKDESIKDTILDSINYLAILYVYLEGNR